MKTASWSAKIPDDHFRIGISRGVARWLKKGSYLRYEALNPGPWFNSVVVGEYVIRYNAILAALDPQKVVADVHALADGKTPVLCCFESVAKIQSGEEFCHRHMVAEWLHDRLGIDVEEVGAPPDFEPFAHLHKMGVPSPTYGLVPAPT